MTTVRDLIERLAALPKYAQDHPVHLRVSPDVYDGIDIDLSGYAEVHLIEGEADCAGFPGSDKED